MKVDNFFSELKRRNVYKVAIAYEPDGDLGDPLLDRIQHELHDRFRIEHIAV